jgi:hypothetical protein
MSAMGVEKHVRVWHEASSYWGRRYGSKWWNSAPAAALAVEPKQAWAADSRTSVLRNLPI